MNDASIANRNLNTIHISSSGPSRYFRLAHPYVSAYL
jgi:hypothetical protein